MSEQSDNKNGLVSRWSRRKLRKIEADSEISSKTAKLDNKSKPTLEKDDELIQQQSELPLWQQDDVAPENMQQALAALFRQPEFKEVDHMNEYDEDFTRFDSLGDIVTTEMKRMLKIVEEKTRPHSLDDIEQVNNTIELDSDESSDEQQNNKEDNHLA